MRLRSRAGGRPSLTWAVARASEAAAARATRKRDRRRRTVEDEVGGRQQARRSLAAGYGELERQEARSCLQFVEGSECEHVTRVVAEKRSHCQSPAQLPHDRPLVDPEWERELDARLACPRHEHRLGRDSTNQCGRPRSCRLDLGSRGVQRAPVNRDPVSLVFDPALRSARTRGADHERPRSAGARPRRLLRAAPSRPGGPPPAREVRWHEAETGISRAPGDRRGTSQAGPRPLPPLPFPCQFVEGRDRARQGQGGLRIDDDGGDGPVEVAAQPERSGTSERSSRAEDSAVVSGCGLEPGRSTDAARRGRSPRTALELGTALETVSAS